MTVAVSALKSEFQTLFEGMAGQDTAKTLSEQLMHVDVTAKQCASVLGPIVARHCSTDKLLWFIGQYRGTILSGKREFGSFYFAPDLCGTEDASIGLGRQRALLGLYWHLHGSVGASIAELFERRCVADERTNSNGHIPRWRILRMSLGHEQGASDGGSAGRCRVQPGECIRGGRHAEEWDSCVFAEGADSPEAVINTTMLQVPDDTATRLVPDKLWRECEQVLEMATGPLARVSDESTLYKKTQEVLQNAPEWSRLQNIARLAVLGEVAKIRWDNSTEATTAEERRTERHGNHLIRFARWLAASENLMPCLPLAEGDDEALQQLLKAIQLMCLYWRFMDQFLATDGSLSLRRKGGVFNPIGDTVANSSVVTVPDRSLFVCVPTPYKHEYGYATGLQPRLGFSALFGHGGDEAVRLIEEDLIPAWTYALDLLATRIGAHCKKAVSEQLEHRGSELLGKNTYAEFRTLLKQLLLRRFGNNGNAGDPEPKAPDVLIDRLLAILEKLVPAVSGFVHEGKRFGVTIFLGLDYHEQVIGEPLGDVRDWVDKHAIMVPTGAGGDESKGDHLPLLKPLIHSCYSLLDWDGVLLFANMQQDKGQVTFTSLRRLPQATRAGSLGETYRKITREHAVLFGLATMDGATVIELGKEASFKSRWETATIVPRELICSSFDVDQSYDESWQHGTWKEWRDLLSWGSRHSSGLALAMARTDVVVVLVSADGPITIMTKGSNPVSRWPRKHRMAAC